MKVTALIDHKLYQKILQKMPIICVDLIIKKNGKVLLIKRKNSPAKGEWWLPGGRILKGETISQAAVRKAREEVGLVVKFKKILSVEETYFKKTKDMKFDVHTINIVVELILKRIDTLKIDKNHSEFKWFTKNSQELNPVLQKLLTEQDFLMSS